MKKVFIILAALAVITFVACGEKKDKLTMSPESTEVKGALSDCFEVVDEECIVKLKDGKLDGLSSVWRVKLRRTDAPLPFEEGLDIDSYGTSYTDGRSFYHVGFGLEIFDEDGCTLDESKATGSGFSGPYSSEDVEEMFKLKPGEEGSIRWSVNSDLLEAKSALTFHITSAYDLVKGSGSSSSSSSSYDDIDVDVDDLLDDYEKALEVSKKSLEAAKKVDKSTKKAMEAYEDALDAYGSMFD